MLKFIEEFYYGNLDPQARSTKQNKTVQKQMEKYIYDENNGLWYELQGDYYIPCLKLPDEEQVEIGIWGQRHLEYIKHHRKGFYTALVLDCKLNRYLADINKQAEEMFDTLISQYKTAEGVTERLKVENQIEWVSRMTNIHHRVVEVINTDLILR